MVAGKDEERFWTLVKYAAIIGVGSLALQFVVNFDSGAKRQILGFNNPNQLGYFTLCLTCIVFAVRVQGSLGFGLFFCLYGVSASLVFLSFSVSAIGSLLLLTSYVVVREGLLSVRSLVALFIAVAIFFTVLLERIVNNEYFIENALYRIGRLDAKTQNIASQRGYSRIWEFPQYTVFGAGEGGRYRWGDKHHHEIHSSIGTVFFSYGVIGFGLFLAFLRSVQYRKGWAGIVLISIPLLYGLTHQGLRTTIFWILLAIVSSIPTAPKSRVMQ